MSGSVYRGPIMLIFASIFLLLDSTKLALCESRFIIIHIYLIVDTGVVHAMSGSSFSYPLPPLKSTFLSRSQGEGLKSSSLRHVLRQLSARDDIIHINSRKKTNKLLSVYISLKPEPLDYMDLDYLHIHIYATIYLSIYNKHTHTHTTLYVGRV